EEAGAPRQGRREMAGALRGRQKSRREELLRRARIPRHGRDPGKLRVPQVAKGLSPMLRRHFLALPFAAAAMAQDNPSWTQPFPAHRVAKNLHYVGSRGLASYLITTDQGHILINSSLTSSPDLIRPAVEKLGYKFSDVRILLISHAHWDH